jgi:AcrR family transcriptional regulator
MDDSTGLRERKKAKTRAAIVDAAYRLFEERGFQATTVADIAADAEIAPRTFFAYFRSKEDVVYCDFDERYASLAAHLHERPAGETAIDALRGWLLGALAGGDVKDARERVRHRLIDDEPALAAHEDHVIARFEGLLREAIARDLGVEADSLRARLAAAAATATLRSLKPEKERPLDQRSALALLDEALVFLRGGIEALQRQESPRP